MKGYRAKAPGEREVGAVAPTMERQMWAAYYRHARNKGRWWKGCVACPPEKRNPKALLEVHHVVARQYLKRVAVDRGWPDFYRLKVLTDWRNSMLLCEGCHHRHTVRAERIRRSVIPGPAWEFAAKHGLTDYLIAEYPGADR